MTALDLSSYTGLVAVSLLTLNVLMGLLLGLRYSPWRSWPHRRFNYFRVHDWTGYLALLLVGIHAALLLVVRSPHFRLLDVLDPLVGPKQPWINALGAAGLYVLTFVVVTAYFRRRFDRATWKVLHYLAYLVAALTFAHGILADPTLTNKPVDYLDGEKVYVEVCLLLVAAATYLRVRLGRDRATVTAGAGALSGATDTA